MVIIDVMKHGVTTLNNGRVESHQSCQIRILFPGPTRYLNSLSKTDLAATILFHAKLLEFDDGASKKDVLGKYFDL